MTTDGLAGRRKLLIGAAGATHAAGGGMLGTALVVYVGRTGSPFAVSMLATAFFVSSMVFSPLWGALGDLLGRRRSLLLVLSAFTSVITFGFLLADGVWGYVGFRGLRAAFAVAFGPLLLSIVRSLVGQTRRGRSVGFVSSTSAAGDVVAQLSVGVLLGLLGPSSLFVVIGSLSLLTTALLAFLDEPRSSADPTPSLRELASNARDRLLPDATELARIRRTGLTWLYVGIAVRHVAVQGIGALIPIYLVARLGLPATVMGAILAVGPATQILVVPLVGRLADRGERKRLVVGGILLSGLYTLLVAGASLPSRLPVRAAVAAAGFVTIATGFSAMDVGAISIIGDAVPASRESAFVGLRATAAGAGGVLGPPIVGAAATVVGFEAAFAVASTFAFAAAALVAARVRRPPSSSAPPPNLGTVETTTGIAQPPGAHRGEDGDR